MPITRKPRPKTPAPKPAPQPDGAERRLSIKNSYIGTSTAYAALEEAIREMKVARELYKRSADVKQCSEILGKLRAAQMIVGDVYDGKRPG